MCNACYGFWNPIGTIAVILLSAASATVKAPFSELGKPYSITWSASATATSYKVQRTSLDDGSVAIVATTAATSATMPTPTTSQFLQYAVQACNAGGCSAFKNASNPTQANPPGPIE
jgi:hypothetical protein